MYLKIKKLHKDARLPLRNHDGDAGMDVFAIEDVHILPRASTLTGLGIACEFPNDYALLILNKSGRVTKQKLDNGAPLIDSNYRGEIHILLFNHSDVAATIFKGEKIAQLVLLPIWNGEPELVTELSETERGAGGFGSTGLI